jgi:WD40 repeat protein/serine/threonine protein kinase
MNEESLFAAALERPIGAERQAFLDAACGDDLQMRGRVEKLLAADEHSSGILDLGLGGESVGTSPFDNSDAGVGTGTGPYKLIEVIGEGGMGTVWLAQQHTPVRRTVALKVIKAGMDSRQVVARFEAERQALALMDHPNIAKVHDGGVTPDGRPYFVMELVKGVPITKYCDENHLTPRQRLELFVPVCLAVQHAHQKGIIHRDIKPSNVLVAQYDGKPVPKVIDFGVAKAAGQPLTEKTLVTGLGTVVGTPEYMSPEQAELNNQDIDTRSDIYSLGVLLYELLTGTTPIERSRFKKAAILEILRLVREEEPPRLSTRLSSTENRASIAAVRGTEPARLAREFRGELDWIAMKALEKDRARRYETANALARDVQRFLADEVVEARPPSLGYRARKFVRRNKARVIAGSLILLALIGGLIGTTYGLIESKNQLIANSLRLQAEQDRDAAHKARDGEQAAKAEVEREKERLAVFEYGRTIQIAYQAWLDGNLSAAVALLEGTRKDLRGWEWDYVHRLCHSDLMTIGGSDLRIGSAVVSPNGKEILTLCSDNTLRFWTMRIWNASSGAEIVVIKGSSPFVSAKYSPDGSRLVTYSQDKSTRLWNAKTGAELFLLTKLPEHRDLSVGSTKSAFSPDGERVLTVSSEHTQQNRQQYTIQIWDTDTGTERLTVKGDVGIVYSAVFSADGERVLITSNDTIGSIANIRMVNTRTGAELLALKYPKQSLWSAKSASFSPDGSKIVTVNGDKTARILDAKTGAELRVLRGHSSEVNSAAFNPNGEWVLTASADKSARIWDVRTGTEVVALRGHTDDVTAAEFSRDGTCVLTRSDDRSARVWDAKSGAELVTLKGHTHIIRSAEFIADGARVVTASADATVRVWDARTTTERRSFKGVPTFATSAGFSSDGTRVVARVYLNEVGVWDSGTGRQLCTMGGHSGPVNSVAFSRDATRVVSASDDKTARIWNAITGTQVAVLKGHTIAVKTATFSPDGAHVLTASSDGTSRIWDASTGLERRQLKGASGFSMATFSPDGTIVAAASYDKTTRIWDARTGAELHILTGHTEWVNSATFSPDGGRVLTISADLTARLWDVRTGTELTTLRGRFSWAAFSRDGTKFVTASNDKTARIWDAQTGSELATLKGHTHIVNSAEFSPDGKRVVTAGFDGTIRIWDSQTGAELLAINTKSKGPSSWAGFSPSGTWILTIGFGRIDVWDSRPVNREFLPQEFGPPSVSVKP